MLVGAGKTGGGGMDASNLLKPALARGLLHCIGATTLQEYKQYIEKDAALERRFQKVFVPEPTVEDAISILRGLKERYEIHHGVHIKDQALVDAVLLSAKNIADRFLPDKAHVLMHMQKGSVRVTSGQSVKAGDVVGLIGSSGDSFGPHLHFQVQTGPELFRYSSVPVNFENLKRVNLLRGSYFDAKSPLQSK